MQESNAEVLNTCAAIANVIAPIFDKFSFKQLLERELPNMMDA